MFSRTLDGRFTSFKKQVKEVMFKLFVFTTVAGFVFTGIFIFAKTKELKAVENKVEISAPKNLDQTFDAQFEENVKSEINRPGFKAQMELYARKQAEHNVMQAYMTKLEQKIK